MKQQIPIRTWGDWTGSAPGAVQGDLVLHCGESTEGFHLSSLVVVDVASGWIELEPIWGVGAVRVGAGVEHIHRRLPVPLRVTVGVVPATVKGRLRAAQVPLDVQNAILSHAAGSVGESYGVGYPTSVLLEAVSKINYTAT